MQVCPVGAEGTTFALNMGLANFGSIIGGSIGIVLLHVLGGVEPPAFTNLRVLVALSAIARLLPLLFIG